MTLHKFNLPDVGEGLTEAEIVAWKVKPGDTVAINDVLCEIETAKSLVELPSPFAGTVTELLVPEGLTVDVGTADHQRQRRGACRGGRRRRRLPPAAPAPDAPLYGKLEADTSDAGESAGRPAGGPLVGSGPKADAVKRRRRVAAPAATPAVSAATAAGPVAASRCRFPAELASSVEAHDIWISPEAVAHAERPEAPARRQPSTSAPPSAAPSAASSTGSWPSRRCARSPGTSASTWPTSSPPAPAAK